MEPKIPILRIRSRTRINAGSARCLPWQCFVIMILAPAVSVLIICATATTKHLRTTIVVYSGFLSSRYQTLLRPFVLLRRPRVWGPGVASPRKSKTLSPVLHPPPQHWCFRLLGFRTGDLPQDLGLTRFRVSYRDAPSRHVPA